MAAFAPRFSRGLSASTSVGIAVILFVIVSTEFAQAAVNVTAVRALQQLFQCFENTPINQALDMEYSRETARLSSFFSDRLSRNEQDKYEFRRMQITSDVFNSLPSDEVCVLCSSCNVYNGPGQASPYACSSTTMTDFTHEGLQKELAVYRRLIRCEAGTHPYAPWTIALHVAQCLARSVKFSQGRYPVHSNSSVKIQVQSVTEYLLTALGRLSITRRDALKVPVQTGPMINARSLAARVQQDLVLKPISAVPIFNLKYYKFQAAEGQGKLFDYALASQTNNLITEVSAAILDQISIVQGSVVATHLSNLDNFHRQAQTTVKMLQAEDDDFERKLQTELNFVLQDAADLKAMELETALDPLQTLVTNMTSDVYKICEQQYQAALIWAVFDFIKEVVLAVVSFGSSMAASTAVGVGKQASRASRVRKAVKSGVSKVRNEPDVVAGQIVDVAEAAGNFMEGQETGIGLFDASVKLANAAGKLAGLKNAFDQMEKQQKQLFNEVRDMISEAVGVFQGLLNHVMDLGAALEGAGDDGPIDGEVVAAAGVSVSSAFWKDFNIRMQFLLITQGNGVCKKLGASDDDNRRRRLKALETVKELKLAAAEEKKQPPRNLVEMMESRASSTSLRPQESRRLDECLNDKTKSKFFGDAQSECTFAQSQILRYATTAEHFHNSIVRFTDLFRSLATTRQNIETVVKSQETIVAEMNQARANAVQMNLARDVQRNVLQQQLKLSMDMDLMDAVHLADTAISELCRAEKYFDPNTVLAVPVGRYINIDMATCRVSFNFPLDQETGTILTLLKDDIKEVLKNADIQKQLDPPVAVREDACEVEVVVPESIRNNPGALFHNVEFNVDYRSFARLGADGSPICFDNQEIVDVQAVLVDGYDLPYTVVGSGVESNMTLAGPLLKMSGGQRSVYTSHPYEYVAGYASSSCDVSSDGTIGNSQNKFFTSPVCATLTTVRDETQKAQASPFGQWALTFNKNQLAKAKKVVMYFQFKVDTGKCSNSVPLPPVTADDSSIGALQNPQITEIISTRGRCAPMGSIRPPQALQQDNSSNLVGIIIGSLAAVAFVAVATVTAAKRGLLPTPLQLSSTVQGLRASITGAGTNPVLAKEHELAMTTSQPPTATDNPAFEIKV